MMEDEKEDLSVSYIVNDQGGYVLNQSGGRIQASQQPNLPSNALTLGGEPLTLDGNFLTVGDLSTVSDRLLDEHPDNIITYDGQIVTNENEILTQSRPIDGGYKDEFNELRPVSSFAWTGRRSTAELRSIVLAAAPSALKGIETLIADLENERPNDDSALEALRELHRALGELIGAAEAGSDLRVQTVLERVQHFISASDATLGSVLRSPTMTIGVLALLGHIFHIDLTTAIFSGLVSGFIKKNADPK